MLPQVAARLGLADALSGRLAEGLTPLQQAVEQVTFTKFTAVEPWVLTHLSEAYLSGGQMVEATESALHALELCHAHKQRGNEAEILLIFGEIHASQDPPGAGSSWATHLLGVL